MSMRLIDAESLKELFPDNGEGSWTYNATAKAYIDAQPEQQNARIFQGVIVEYPTNSTYPEHEEKPYFLIKYTEDGQDFIGYGTYKPDVLSEYLKKYFMPSAQPDIITCGDCKWRIRHDKRCGYWNHGVKPDMWCSQAERREDG